MSVLRVIIGLLLWGLIPCSFGQAQHSIPADSAAIEMRYLLKSLNYDRNYKTRSAASLNILIVHEQSNPDKLANNLLLAATSELIRKDIRVTATRFKSIGALLRLVKNKQITLIYIDPSALKKLSSILQVTRGLKIPSFTRGRRLVKAGVSVGVYRDRGKTQLVINRKAAKIEGLYFDSSLLAIATLIR